MYLKYELRVTIYEMRNEKRDTRGRTTRGDI